MMSNLGFTWLREILQDEGIVNSGLLLRCVLICITMSLLVYRIDLIRCLEIESAIQYRYRIEPGLITVSRTPHLTATTTNPPNFSRSPLLQNPFEYLPRSILRDRVHKDNSPFKPLVRRDLTLDKLLNPILIQRHRPACGVPGTQNDICPRKLTSILLQDNTYHRCV